MQVASQDHQIADPFPFEEVQHSLPIGLVSIPDVGELNRASGRREAREEHLLPNQPPSDPCLL
jgi:hypothetical protein